MMVDPSPDIHELFCYYNSLYFSEALGTCIVSWAPHLNSMAASCDFMEEGLCEITLSVPLLKSCSSADLKNILLHEMIHAFSWIAHKNNNHSDHGSRFWKMANLINSNCRDDDQRPSNGYNITASHGLQNDKDAFSAQLQMGGMNGEEPSLINCTEKNGDDDHGKFLCRCQRLENVCLGGLEKKDDVFGFKNKDKSIGVQDCVGDKQRDFPQFNKQAKQRLLPAEEIKEKRVIKRPRIMADYLSYFGGKPNNSGKKSSQADCSNNGNHSTTTDLRTRSLIVGPEIPKQRRTSCRKSCNLSLTEENLNRKRRREINLVMPLFDVCTDEESEEDLEPLINKRSERRKKMKFNSSDGRAEQIADMTPCEVISLD